ncbi:hypothetical protein GCM10025867_08350 [Frondihabitans sucicola]|uniref:Uncharacterized protein n=1 Tax=Frondihabitans sucicola TaxID=1268041 RepID=A0ABM8GJN5_9MICO|nr:hypothetical protein [Frondihabitans sucicola]BDZ48594.1 hypothetical protein GCM10025867_08350 [Frondihabitans sucicola]
MSVRVGSVLSAEDTETHLATIRAAGTLLLDDLETRQYRQIGRISDEPTNPEPLVQDEALLSALPSKAIEALLAAFDATSGAELAVVEIRHLGGALARRPSYESAFSYRDAPYSVLTVGFAPAGETETVTSAGARVLASVADLSEGRILGNFVATSDPERASRAFDEASRARLLRLVDIYDPSHVLAL